jgi:hypothetical protein
MMLFSWRDNIGTPGRTDWSAALEVEVFFDIIYYITLEVAEG